jgi:AcrR family transcriptional regulator
VTGVRRKDDEKQQNIKNAVVRLILEEGFQGASISKIARVAGVSPATVYIYYDNKEAMLRDIYREYAGDAVRCLLQCVHPGMDGEEIIAQLVRRYYDYIVRNRDVFYFIEQFNTCPALCGTCRATQGPAYLNRLLTELKQKQIFNDFDNDNLYAILFSPVKMIASRSGDSGEAADDRLDELIRILQKALIRHE